MEELYRKRPDKLASRAPDDIMSRNVLAQMRKDPPPAVKLGAVKEAVDSGDLVASMAKRLTLLESSLRKANTALAHSRKEVEQLTTKLHAAEAELALHTLQNPIVGNASSSSSSSSSSNVKAEDASTVAQLRLESQQLQAQAASAWQQVADMKAFLQDYGMVWVGDSEPGSATAAPSGAWYHASSMEPVQALGDSGAAAGKHIPMQGRGYRLGHGPTFSSAAAGSSRPASSHSQQGQTIAATPTPKGGDPASTAVAAAGGSPRPTAPGPGASQPAAGLKAAGPGPPLARRSWAAGLPPLDPHSDLLGSAAPPFHTLLLPPCLPLAPTAAAGGRVSQPGTQTPITPGVPDGSDKAGAAAGLLLGGKPPRVSNTGQGPPPSGCLAGQGSPPAPHPPASPPQDHVRAAAGQPPGVGAGRRLRPHSGLRRSVTQTEALQGPVGPSPPSTAPGTPLTDPLSPSAPCQPEQQQLSSPLSPPVSASHPPNHPTPPKPMQSHACHASLPFRMADLLARVEELNCLAGDGCGQLVPGGGGGAHVLHTPEAVRLVVFRDGLQLHRGPCRPWQHVGTAAILADLLDGYFPGPLKQEYPDGVPIKVVDRSTESYQEAYPPKQPQSGGSGARGGQGGVHSWQDLEEAQGRPLSRDKFLAKLPQTVIKNGKVMDIRGGVGRLLNGPAPGPSIQVAVVNTAADALLTTSQRKHCGPVLPPPSRDGATRPPLPLTDLEGAAVAGVAAPAAPPGSGPAGAPETKGGEVGASSSKASVPEITTLQVKSEDGQQTLIVKAQYDDTVGALRSYIDAHRAKQKEGERTTNYEIRTAFPPRAYTNPQETLRAAGLIPNATLFLKQPSSTS
ncbi:hypothetical protein QJQ45_025966 [Haematococcus lacustris]|nr:hypothetical protein QJQ45_025966 [Haematococcus lacustris]